MDDIQKLATEISIENFTDDCQLVANVIGIESTLLLSKHLGGINIYIPKYEKLIQTYRDNKIYSEFNGANHKELARKYNLTEVWIRKIVQSHPRLSQNSQTKQK